MNGNYDVDTETFDSTDSFLFGDTESGPYDFYDMESRGRRRPRPVRPAQGRPLTTPRPGGGAPTGNFVTQAQLDAALARARSEITANATAIKTVDGRVRTAVTDMQKLQSITRKDLDKLRSDLRTTQTLSALVPMIATGNSKFAKLAPLVHLLPSGSLSGTSTPGAEGANSLLGNNSNLIAIAAIAYASGAFD